MVRERSAIRTFHIFQPNTNLVIQTTILQNNEVDANPDKLIFAELCHVRFTK